jgi:pantetheine-phosphate adenylyltransferase
MKEKKKGQPGILMPHPQPSSRIAVYPGSFDPITLGHLNVMERAAKLFDRLIVGVGVNIEKETMFTPEERQALIRTATAHLENVEIRMFTGLAVGFVKQCDARIIIRGVRPITDIAAELTMMMANRRLAPDVETLFMIADGELAHVSSSLIKQIASVASDAELEKFLPHNVIRALRARVEAAERG